MTMVFRELNEIEYEKFVSSHPQANLLQASYSGKRRITDGWNMHLVGMVENGKIIASALLSSRKTFFGFYDFECQHGPLVDYDDANKTSLFFKNISSYVKGKNGLGIKINPNIPLNRYDTSEIIIDDKYDGHKYIELITKSDFSKIDDKLVDNDPNLLRWYFKKDIKNLHNEDDILNSVSVKTRQDMQRSVKMGVDVEAIDVKDIDIFIKLMKDTGIRRKFSVRDKNYYLSLLNSFGKSRSMCLIAKLNIPKYIKYLNNRIENEKYEIDLAANKSENSPKVKLQITAHKNQIIQLKEKIKEAKEKISDPPVVMAGAIFINYGSEMTYLSSGAYTEYSKFCSTYAIQFYAMKYAVEHKLSVYNFYGTEGLFSGHPEMNGIYNFKKGFSGYLEEQIGYFYKNIRPIPNFIIAMLRKIRKILR